MKLRGWLVALAIFAGSVPFAIAQSDFKPSSTVKEYVPRQVEIMSAAQLQHLKLWFAGKAKNWDLAAYELLQLKDSLVQAAVLYPGIPASNLTTLMAPLQSLSDAITAKDGRRFVSAIGELTDGCNACHRSMERGFVVIRLPSDREPPANQLFAPQGKMQ
jgi:hypothetical protein